MSIASADSTHHRCRRPTAARVLVGLVLAVLVATAPASRADEIEDAYRAGVALAERGRLEESVPYFEDALRLARTKFGEGTPETAVEVSNLAEVYRRLRRYDEALPLAREAVELDEASDRGEDADTAASLNNLALILVAKGEFAEAEELHRRSLRILQDKLGPAHPDVARSLHNLAVAYAERGQPERALPLEQRARTIAVNALGPGHPVTQRIDQSIASLQGKAPTKPAVAAATGSTAAASIATAARRPDPSAPRPQQRPVRPGDPQAVETTLQAALAEAPAPSVAQPPTTPTVPAASTPAAGASTPAAAGGIADAPAADGSYYALLSSVGDPDKLPQEWKRLQRRHAVLREETALRSLPASGSKKLWRLMTGPYAARGDAQAICTAVVANKGRCEVIRR